MKNNHIGYAVKNVSAARSAFLALGYRAMTEPFVDNGRSLTVQFLEKDGYVVELLSPTNTSSPVSALLSKVGNTPYHICY